MRIEISHKFIMGFIIVVGSVVLLNLLVPHLGIPGHGSSSSPSAAPCWSA